MEIPRTRYAKAVDGVHIAYQVPARAGRSRLRRFGSTGNFDVEGLEEPRERGVLRGTRVVISIGPVRQARNRVVGPEPDASLEMRADDLRAVLDAVGSDRAVVMGGGADGGALAAFFAATHPERVQELILNTAYAQERVGARLPDRHEGGGIPRRSVKTWGGRDGARSSRRRSGWSLQAPSLSQDTEVRRVVRQVDASRRLACRRARIHGHVVRHRCSDRVLGSVQAPTLVLAIPGASEQASGGPESHGWWTGSSPSGLPGAKYVELPGRDLIKIKQHRTRGLSWIESSGSSGR